MRSTCNRLAGPQCNAAKHINTHFMPPSSQRTLLSSILYKRTPHRADSSFLQLLPLSAPSTTTALHNKARVDTRLQWASHTILPLSQSMASSTAGTTSCTAPTKTTPKIQWANQWICWHVMGVSLLPVCLSHRRSITKLPVFTGWGEKN